MADRPVTYTFSDESYWDDNGCDCCSPEYVQCWNLGYCSAGDIPIELCHSFWEREQCIEAIASHHNIPIKLGEPIVEALARQNIFVEFE